MVGRRGDPVRVPSCNYTLSFALKLMISVRLARKMLGTVLFVELVTAFTGSSRLGPGDFHSLSAEASGHFGQPSKVSAAFQRLIAEVRIVYTLSYSVVRLVGRRGGGSVPLFFEGGGNFDFCF